MMRSRKLLPLAFVALQFLAACELVDAVEVAVSGPECGGSGVPDVLKNTDLYIHDWHRFDWGRIDEGIALLQPYEHTHNPYIMASLGVLYARKAVTLSDDPAYFRRAARLFAWTALCDLGGGAFFLAGLVSEGLGVEKNPELASCLRRAYDANIHDYVPIAGRAWGCGVRLENFPE
jgi:hypothetical protein